MNKHHLQTVLQHVGQANFDPNTGAAPVAMPSMRTSTVRFKSLADLEQAMSNQHRGGRSVVYGRAGMDTHRALEDVFCELEDGKHAFLVPSGMAAISLGVLSFVEHGDHILVADSAYAPVRALDSGYLKKIGVEVSYCEPKVEAFQAALRPNTKMLYVESPGSLLLQMLDLPALSAFAKEHGLITVADNTWGSGLHYQPLRLGIDVAVISATKYIGGHSDFLMGAVVTARTDLVAHLQECHYALGYSVSADDVWLALRGVRTLPIRMRESATNAIKVCEALAQWPEIQQIYHPAWPNDPGHALWLRDATGSNGVLSVQLATDPERAVRFVNGLRLFGIGFSWGGFESLVQLVDTKTLTHHSYWQGHTSPLVRLHIGLEQPEDLIADLTQAWALSA